MVVLYTAAFSCNPPRIFRVLMHIHENKSVAEMSPPEMYPQHVLSIHLLLLLVLLFLNVSKRHESLYSIKFSLSNRVIYFSLARPFDVFRNLLARCQRGSSFPFPCLASFRHRRASRGFFQKFSMHFSPWRRSANRKTSNLFFNVRSIFRMSSEASFDLVESIPERSAGIVEFSRCELPQKD